MDVPEALVSFYLRTPFEKYPVWRIYSCIHKKYDWYTVGNMIIDVFVKHCPVQTFGATSKSDQLILTAFLNSNLE